MSTRTPKVRWGAAGGESAGPYERNSIRPDAVVSLLVTCETQRTDARRRETALRRRAQNARTRQAQRKRTWGGIGWLETERQKGSCDVKRGSSSEGRLTGGRRQSPRSSEEAP